jgi:hypothetical protein
MLLSWPTPGQRLAPVLLHPLTRLSAHSSRSSLTFLRLLDWASPSKRCATVFPHTLTSACVLVVLVSIAMAQKPLL